MLQFGCDGDVTAFHLVDCKAIGTKDTHVDNQRDIERRVIAGGTTRFERVDRGIGGFNLVISEIKNKDLIFFLSLRCENYRKVTSKVLTVHGSGQQILNENSIRPGS